MRASGTLLERSTETQPPRRVARSRWLLDERPRMRSPLEWWYVNGCLEGAGVPRAHFFVLAFRHRVKIGRRPALGWELIAGWLDEATGRHRSLVCINEALQRGAVDLGSDLPLNTDPRLAKCLRDEVARHGPLEPVTRRDDPVEFATETLDIRWGDLALRQEQWGFRLRFTRPGAAEACNLLLRPVAPRLRVLPRREQRESPMHYVSYPRLALAGTCDGIPVSGQAWMDHQWGDYGFIWHRAKSRRRAVAWDWIGAALDDGTDLVATCVRDARLGRHRIPGLLLRLPSGRIRATRKVRVERLGEWTSPATGITHPNFWRIRSAELKADLVFRPLAAGQEAVGFFLSHGLWEGAGRVEGTLNGRAVSGRAFGEAQGNGYIFDLKAALTARGAGLDRHIEQVLPRSLTPAASARLLGDGRDHFDSAAGSAMINEPAWDLLGRQGKRWRPLFGLLLLDALGVDPSPYEDVVTAVSELPHNGSLIIDDIEDNSLLRRGGPAIHIKYGLDLAINAGNALYFLPLLMLKEHPALTPAQRLEAHELLAAQFVRAHMGQALDLYWSRNMSRPRLHAWLGESIAAKILEMYSLKTGAPVEGLAEMAAVIAGGGDTVRRRCAEFARSLAVAFQIVDDVHNFSRSPKWRKTRGEDIAGGKLTYVIVSALQRLDARRSARLARILCARSLRGRPKHLQEGIALVRASGALEACLDEARSMLRGPWEELAPFLRMNRARVVLRAFCEHLVDLEIET